MAGPRTKTITPEQLDKENAVLELRRSGATCERIAQAVGYANASGAMKAYRRVVNRVQRESVDEIRQLELDRLDRLQNAYWKSAVVELNHRSVEVLLKIMDKRAKLLGLDAPQRLQAEVMTYDGTHDYNADIERIIGLLDQVDSRVAIPVDSRTGPARTIGPVG